MTDAPHPETPTADTRDHSIFGLLKAFPAPLWRWAALLLLVGCAWLGGVAWLAPFRPTEVSRLLEQVAPLPMIYWIALGLSGALGVAALLGRARTLAYAALTVAGYLLAWQGAGWLYQSFDPDVVIPLESNGDAIGFALSRLWFGLPMLVALGAVALLFRPRAGEARPMLGLGDWRGQSRDLGRKPHSWAAILFGGYLIFIAVMIIVLQSPVAFEPITSGRLLALIPGVLLCAAVNALAEELVYRGFLQPAFVRFAGPGAGLWMQGLLFGLVHWGLSVGVLAALPVSLLIGFGSVVWGKAALETRGLAWTVVAHFLIDVAIMAAYFV